MSSLDDIAKRYLVYEKSDISDFQRKARILQSMWRTEKGFEPGIFRGRKLGSLLPMPWAKETLNNYLSDTIKQIVMEEVIDNPDEEKLYGKPRIFNNLLSGQPLCFNLFAELKVDLDLASIVFHTLCSDRVKEVTKIEFEYSPGRRDVKYTGDRSAFDVYIEFLSNSDKKGFIGIEVKYHEHLQNKPAKMRERYFEVASEMNCFEKSALDRLQQKPLEQIWRDHLLAGSILNTDDFQDGLFVFLCPKDNPHCQDAVKEYKKCLTDERTFESWTLEKVTNTIKNNTKEQWIDKLIDRYLNFSKIDSII